MILPRACGGDYRRTFNGDRWTGTGVLPAAALPAAPADLHAGCLAGEAGSGARERAVLGTDEHSNLFEILK